MKYSSYYKQTDKLTMEVNTMDLLTWTRCISFGHLYKYNDNGPKSSTVFTSMVSLSVCLSEDLYFMVAERG